MASSSTSCQTKYDVFVSFRGPDARDTFVSHLFDRLEKAKIIYFSDKDPEDLGKEIDKKIFKAIKHARIALIVFSATYADSRWCLDELVEILNCKRDHDLRVIPIFYVPVAEVKKWREIEFKQALDKLVGIKREVKQNVWTSAVAEATNLQGLELKADANGNEAVLICKIVEHLVKEIWRLDPAKNSNPRAHSVEDFGPFGCKCEKTWDFVDVKGIAVHYADFIKSITFDDVDADSSKLQSGKREKTFKVKLENGEFITSFAGYSNEHGSRILINSLTFGTNKRILGPIGREEGQHFSLPSEAGKVTGFFGTSGDFLESIGARVEPCYPFESVGLFGWDEGEEWNFLVKQINLRIIIVELDSSGERFIRSITFWYGENNKPLESKTYGGADGSEGEKSERIQINVTDEYLTSISGYTYQPNRRTTGGITSLTFQTNKRTIGPIGDEKGTHFSSPATGGKIVKLYGWSDQHLHGIGAHFEPISDLYPIRSVKSIGPFGGPGEQAWDKEIFPGVREVEVMHGDHICYIKIVYDVDGKQRRTVKHGNGTGRKNSMLDKVTLDYPREYLTSISGYMQEVGGEIQSLTFYSNRRRLGPFGKETGKGKYFWYPSTRSKIIGFHGSYGKGLNAIGVYAEPIKEPYRFRTIEPFKGSGGTPWDDGVHTDVRGFRFSIGDEIHSIEIAYDNNGSFVQGPEHGEKGNDKYVEVMLDYPKERLGHISVWMERKGSDGPTIIRNLRIVTTKTYYGPYFPKSQSKKGKLDQDALEKYLGRFTEFCIPSEPGGGRIVGFFGREGTRLHSIGARLEPY